MKTVIFLIGLVLMGLLSVTLLRTIQPAEPVAGQKAVPESSDEDTVPKPVIVELFTSEGCSSCPSADAVLAALVAEQSIAGAQIIPLALHVDYWDELGWTDQFASAEYTVRQHQYSVSLGLENVYTPQAIVDGRVELIGSRKQALSNAIERATQFAKVPLQLTLAETADTAAISVTILTDEPPAGEPLELLLAVTEYQLESEVTAGENRGKRLPHIGVVRLLKKIATLEPGTGAVKEEATVPLEALWQREQLHLVAFLQERQSRAIVGAASLPLAALMAETAASVEQ